MEKYILEHPFILQSKKWSKVKNSDLSVLTHGPLLTLIKRGNGLLGISSVLKVEGVTFISQRNRKKKKKLLPYSYFWPSQISFFIITWAIAIIAIVFTIYYYGYLEAHKNVSFLNT